VAKIVLEVDDTNLGSVITVLNALKDGLIVKMEINSLTQEESKESQNKKFTRYQPRVQQVNYEEDQEKLTSMGKYIDPSEFKKRLRKK